MKRLTLVLILLICSISSLHAQNSVDIDGRLQPILDSFKTECEKYGIDYHDKLFQLKKIDITNTLPLEEGNTVLGMVTRDDNNNIKEILINWAAMLDPEILKVVAFHEFAHHFLDYKHTCENCNEIMAVTNDSYFAIANDWDNQVIQLFTTSPAFLAKQAQTPIASVTLQ